MGKAWKKGRGKLGVLSPLLGRWTAASDSPMGPVRCSRVFEPALSGAYVRLEAVWEFGPSAMERRVPREGGAPVGGKSYQELAVFGAGDGGRVEFWSFTSDGKRSQGAMAEATDIHSDAIAFEARMPAGLARMAYWPDGGGGFFFAVESKNKKGWRRFLEHHYRPA
jgi:hypothetical protein